MRKVIALALVFTTILLLSGCSAGNIEFIGIDRVGNQTAPKVSAGLLPKLDAEYYHNDPYMSFNAFNRKFQSTESDAFCFGEYGLLFDDKEYVLVYYKYDKETYEEAKAYTFENLSVYSQKDEKYDYTLNDQTVYAEYNSYVIYTKTKDIESKKQSDAEIAKFFAYNDETQTLVFFGSSLPGFRFKKEREIITNNFPEYLKIFSIYYDFSK